MKTKAAVLRELGRPLEMMMLDVPKPGFGQVLVEVAFSGVCRSQLMEVRGLKGPDPYVPHCLGHEGSGVVIEAGPGVSKVKPGDHVVLSWIKGLGADVSSTVYRSGNGPVNSGAISTFMDLTITSENRLTPVSHTMPLREAALLGCAIPTGAGSVLKLAEVRPGESVAVFGAGGVGLSAIAGACLANAFPVVAVDIFDHKLEQAKHLGATHGVNAQEAGAFDTLMEIAGGSGFDCSVESAGSIRSMEMAIAVAHQQRGKVIVAGNLPKGEVVSVDPFDLICGKRILGSWGGGTDPDKDIPRYAALFLADKLPLKRWITHTFPLEDINQALDALEKGEVGRALIDNRSKVDSV